MAFLKGQTSVPEIEAEERYRKRNYGRRYFEVARWGHLHNFEKKKIKQKKRDM